MNRALGILLVSGTAGVVFTSALGLAQVPQPAAGPFPPAKAEPVLKKAVLRPGVVANRAANLENMIQQFVNQGRPAVRAELILVRKVCRPDTEVLKKIYHDAEDALKRAATQLADAQLQGRLAAAMRKNIAGTPVPANLVGPSLLQAELTAVMKTDLPAERFAEYQAEVDKRTTRRKQAAVAYLVNALDQDLYLSADQRVKLAESLLAHWDESWNMPLEYMLYGNQFQPLGVDRLVTPYLNAAQAKVWQGTQKVNGIGGAFGVWGGFLNDNDRLEVELGVPAAVVPGNDIRILRKNMMKQALPVPVEPQRPIVKPTGPDN